MAFVDPQAVRQMEGWNKSWQADGQCRAMFYQREVLDEHATHGWTEEQEVLNDDGSVRLDKKRFPGAGRPIFKTVWFIRKFTPGDQFNIPDREMYPSGGCRCGNHGPEVSHDAWEFPREWEAAQKGTDQLTGTPIEMLPGIAPARIEELKHFPGAPVRTIEELAAMNDGVLQRFMGLQSDRQRARDWIAAAEKAAPLAAVRAEMAEKDKAMDEMKERLAVLEQALKEAQTEHKSEGKRKGQ